MAERRVGVRELKAALRECVRQVGSGGNEQRVEAFTVRVAQGQRDDCI
jgi:hypothetical protein